MKYWVTVRNVIEKEYELTAWNAKDALIPIEAIIQRPLKSVKADTRIVRVRRKPKHLR